MFLSHGFWVFLTLEFFLSPTSDPSLQLLPPVLEDIGCFRGKNALESPLSSGIGLRGMASLWHFPAPGCARILPRWSWCGGGKEGIPFGSQPLLGLVPECALGAHRQTGYHHLPACAPHLPQEKTQWVSLCRCCCGPVCTHSEGSACSHHLWHGGEAGGEPPFSIAIVASVLLLGMSFPLG